MLKSLQLADFRNHQMVSFDFTADKVVFFGANGRGKTNVLEAISLLSMGKSWREQTGGELIGEGQESAQITAQIAENDYTLTVLPRARELRRNGKKMSFKKHLGQFPTLLFAPEHLSIFHGSKTGRQQFFDRFLIQIYPTYAETLSRARKAAQQKNALLRQQEEVPVSAAMLVPWNQILAETIPMIWQTRQQFLVDIETLLQTELAKISGNDDVIALNLIPGEEFEPSEAGVQEFFTTHFARECAARKNLLSPTRDDFAFSLRHKPLLATASRGEERSVLLALLSAKKQWLQKIRGFFPILLLDDVFSELDDDRQKHLEALCADTQVFFTTTHEEHFAAFAGDVQKVSID